MASLKETAQLADELEELVGQLRSELQNGEVDFEKLVTLSDQLSERADGLAETFNSINDTLMQRIEQARSGGGSKGSARKAKSEAKASGS